MNFCFLDASREKQLTGVSTKAVGKYVDHVTADGPKGPNSVRAAAAGPARLMKLHSENS